MKSGPLSCVIMGLPLTGKQWLLASLNSALQDFSLGFRSNEAILGNELVLCSEGLQEKFIEAGFTFQRFGESPRGRKGSGWSFEKLVNAYASRGREPSQVTFSADFLEKIYGCDDRFQEMVIRTFSGPLFYEENAIQLHMGWASSMILAVDSQVLPAIANEKIRESVRKSTQSFVKKLCSTASRKGQNIAEFPVTLVLTKCDLANADTPEQLEHEGFEWLGINPLATSSLRGIGIERVMSSVAFGGDGTVSLKELCERI